MSRKEKDYRSQFYQRINKYELYDEIKKSVQNESPTQRFQFLIYCIAHKLSRNSRFKDYTEDWKVEAICGGALKAISVYEKFDLEKTESAYSYFHTVVKNAMIDVIVKDYTKYHEMKKNLMKIKSVDYNDIYYDHIEDAETFETEIDEED